VLAEPPRTNWDLHFRLFGFPVRVHPFFWLLAALFAYPTWESLGPQYFIIWVGVLFVSILIHELGHGLAYRFYGARSHLVLHGFGGLAIPWTAIRGRGRRILVSLAGPAAGFILAGLVWGTAHLFDWANPERSRLLHELYVWLILVNVGWGVINLLPVYPLDGGQVCQEVCSQFSPRTGLQLSLQISLFVASLMCFYSVACVISVNQGAAWIGALPWWIPLGSPWTAVLFGLLAYQSYQMLQQSRWMDSHWDN
jgi:Zn-dependent protease